MVFFPVISLFLFALYGVLILYYLRSWKAMPPFGREGRAAAAGQEDPVWDIAPVNISVLIPARNEEKNIGACLDSLLSQRYPRTALEIIVIDDHSSDGTAALVRQYAGLAPNIRYLRLADHLPPEGSRAYKKFAIETAIGHATGELIVTTDADCWAGPDWLMSLAGVYRGQGAKFIAAPVKIEGDSSLLTIFQQLDFITLQGITGAAVYKQVHSMCNGANLAYEKEAFKEVGGFRDIDSIPSGDDMLLMHKIYQRYPERVFFLKDERAIVSTHAETTWKGFINQRVRWASKADKYDDRRIFWVLLLVYIVNLLFLIFLAAAFINTRYFWVLLVALIAKTIIEYPFVRSVSSFFGQRRLMRYFAVLQPLHILYTIVIGWMGKFGSYSWKERKISK